MLIIDTPRILHMVPQERDITANLLGAYVSVAASTDGKVKRLPGVTCVRSPLQSPAFNSAFLQGRAGVNGRTLREVQEFFRKSRVGWCFRVPPRLTSLLGDVMGHIRISRCTSEPEMILQRHHFTFKRRPPGLEVKTVSNFKELRVWSRTASLGFEASSAFFRPLKENALGFPGLTYFIGFNHGKPVATAVSYISDRIVGVYGVSTIPKARGQGFGEAVTAVASEDGFSKGCGISSLQASPKGYPVYYRMGYRHLFDYQHWFVKHPKS